MHNCDPAAHCQLCIPHYIASNVSYLCGAGCDGDCSTDEECGDSNCPYCDTGTGKCAGLLPSGCGEICNDGKHVCEEGAHCEACVKDAEKPWRQVCGVVCGAACATDGECAPGPCNQCYNGKCTDPAAVPQNCLGQCETIGCNSSGECNICTYGNICGVGCNGACTADAHCLGGPLCSYCIHGRCGNGCQAQCTTDADCYPGTCPACSGGICRACGANCTDDSACTDSNCANCIGGKCLSGCGENCTADADCPSRGNHPCSSCTGGVCQVPAPPTPAPPPPAACRGNCTVNTDCAQDGACGLCTPKTSTEFWCTAACGGPCTADEQCGVVNCMHCTDGACAAA